MGSTGVFPGHLNCSVVGFGNPISTSGAKSLTRKPCQGVNGMHMTFNGQTVEAGEVVRLGYDEVTTASFEG